jgi:hypothetical protein
VAPVAFPVPFPDIHPQHNGPHSLQASRCPPEGLPRYLSGSLPADYQKQAAALVLASNYPPETGKEERSCTFPALVSCPALLPEGWPLLHLQKENKPPPWYWPQLSAGRYGIEIQRLPISLLVALPGIWPRFLALVSLPPLPAPLPDSLAAQKSRRIIWPISGGAFAFSPLNY